MKCCNSSGTLALGLDRASGNLRSSDVSAAQPPLFTIQYCTLLPRVTTAELSLSPVLFETSRAQGSKLATTTDQLSNSNNISIALHLHLHLHLPQHCTNKFNCHCFSSIMGGETVETAKPESTYPQLSAKPVGQWIPSIYKNRIGAFYGGGQYETKNLRAYAKSLYL